MFNPDRRVIAGIAAGLLVVLALAVGGRRAYQHLFFHHAPAFRVSESLLAAVRARPLTADEFAAAVAVSGRGERVVEYRALAVVRSAAARNPEYRPAAGELYARLAAGPSDPRRQATAQAMLARLQPPGGRGHGRPAGEAERGPNPAGTDR